MKINCDMAKDLLPQYYDGTLNEATAGMVEEHLKECENCRAYYEEIIKINEELDNDSGSGTPVKGSEGGLAKIKKRLARQRLIAVVIAVSVMILLAFGVYLFADLHYTYIPYEDTGIVVRGDEIRTTQNYAMLIGEQTEINGENVEFIVLLSSPLSRMMTLKGEMVIYDMSLEGGDVSEDALKTMKDNWGEYGYLLDSMEENPLLSKIYYLPESAIYNPPFIFTKDYSHKGLLLPDYDVDTEKLVDESVLIWSREG